MTALSGERPRIAVVGDLMVDVSVRAGELASGGDVHGDVSVRAGGAGANAAVWAASRGVDVALFGRVGDDVAGRVLVDSVTSRGVEARIVRDPSVRTGAVLAVHEANERSMVADRGANARLAPADLPDELLADAVLVSGYLVFHAGSEPAALAALGRARADHVAIDAASWPLVEAFGAERFLETTAAATLVLANEREAEALTGSTGEKAARLLGASYGSACVKLGEGGAVLVTGDEVVRAHTEPADAVDPTGAGDAFAGVLLAELVKGAGAERALREAVDAATRSVGSPSPWPEP